MDKRKQEMVEALEEQVGITSLTEKLQTSSDGLDGEEEILEEEESTDQRLAEMSCLPNGRDQSQIRSNLQETAARGESYRFNNLRDKVKQQLDSCKEIEATCDNQMSRWQEEPQEHGQSHDQVGRLSPKIA